MLYGITDAVVNIAEFYRDTAPPVALSRDELIGILRERVTRPLIVVAAACGSEAHTVGLSAILAAKGVKGERSLETYPFFNNI